MHSCNGYMGTPFSSLVVAGNPDSRRYQTIALENLYHLSVLLIMRWRRGGGVGDKKGKGGERGRPGMKGIR